MGGEAPEVGWLESAWESSAMWALRGCVYTTLAHSAACVDEANTKINFADRAPAWRGAAPQGPTPQHPRAVKKRSCAGGGAHAKGPPALTQTGSR